MSPGGHPGTHISASQIETWRGCQRKWAYSRIRPRTENEYAAFGTRVHRILERWLEERLTPDHTTPEGLCALAAVPELPTPQQAGAAVEHAFAFVSDGTRIVLADAGTPCSCGQSRADTIEDAARLEALARGVGWVAYVGRIDLLDAHQPGTYVRITDYKTCGDLERADETRASFEENVQRVIYSVYVRERFRVESVLARWLYLRRKPPKAEAVELVEDAANTLARFARVHQKYSLPIVQAHGIHPTELPRDLSHCFAYGPRMPCPYLQECHATLDPIERAAALMSQPERGHTRKKDEPMMNDLMAQLNASMATPAAAAPAITDPFAGWSDQDKEAYAALQSPPPGATQEIVATFLAANGKQHVVDAAVRAGVIAVAQAVVPEAPSPVAAPQPVAVAPSPVTPIAGSGAPQHAPAPRVRAKSFKADVVENMLRAVLAGAGHSVTETEAHIARLLG